MGLFWELYSIEGARAEALARDPRVFLEATQRSDDYESTPYSAYSQGGHLHLARLMYRSLRSFARYIEGYGGPIGDYELESFNMEGGGYGYVWTLQILAAFALGEAHRHNVRAQLIEGLGTVQLSETWFLSPAERVLETAQRAKRCVLPERVTAADLRAYRERFGYDSGLSDEDDIAGALACVDDFRRLRNFFIRHAAAGRGLVVSWG